MMSLRAERFDLAIGEVLDRFPEPLTQEKTGSVLQMSTSHSTSPAQEQEHLVLLHSVFILATVKMLESWQT